MFLRQRKLRRLLRLRPGASLRIGGIRLLIDPPPSTRVEILNPLYRSFLAKNAAGKSGPQLEVRLHSGKWPCLRSVERKFDAHDSWSAHSRGKTNWLSLAPRLGEEPMWVARFASGAGRVDLYCRFRREGKSGRRIIDLPLVYPLDQLLLMYYFARRKGMLAHAAGMVLKGKAYLFAGASGAGKSTFSELLVQAKLGKVLSDERMIVREIKGEMIAFGTPWAGTALIARSGSAPMAAVFFLKHGRENRVVKLDPVAASDRLLPMLSIPWYDPDTVAPIIAFAKRVMANVPAFEFQFTPDRSAVEFFRKFMKISS